MAKLGLLALVGRGGGGGGLQGDEHQPFREVLPTRVNHKLATAQKWKKSVLTERHKVHTGITIVLPLHRNGRKVFPQKDTKYIQV